MTKPKGADVAATWEPVGSLKPWAKNPRKNDGRPVDELVANMRRFGFTAPILARADTREIIAGHTRWKAAQKAGLDRVAVRFLDVTDAEAHAIALADNRLGELAAWDDDLLAEVLRDLEAASFDLDGLGWSADEIDALLAEPAAEMPEPSDDAPEVQEGPPDSVPGAVYELGPHRLVCGDCRDPAVVATLLAGRKINVAFTSPPYASQRKYDESSGFKPIPPDDYVDWFDAVQANVRAHLATDGSWFVNIKEHSEEGQRHLYVKDLTIAHVRRWGWRLVDELCWLRQSLPGDPISMGKFKNGFEPVFHYTALRDFKFRPDDVRRESVHAFRYEDQKKAGRNISSASQGKGNNAQSPVGQGLGLAYPSNVIDVKQGANVVGHAAAYPVALPEFFIKAYSDPGDLVFDPFVGSGTTIIAAAKNGRAGYGCEISPNYCDLIRRRWTRYAREAGVDPGPGALEG